MPKALCIVGMVIAGLLLILFGLHLVPPLVSGHELGIDPFKGSSALFAIGFIVFALGLGYLSWSTYREQV